MGLTAGGGSPGVGPGLGVSWVWSERGFGFAGVPRARPLLENWGGFPAGAGRCAFGSSEGRFEKDSGGPERGRGGG